MHRLLWCFFVFVRDIFVVLVLSFCVVMADNGYHLNLNATAFDAVSVFGGGGDQSNVHARV